MCKGPVVRGKIQKQGNENQAQGDWTLRETESGMQDEKPLKEAIF